MRIGLNNNFPSGGGQPEKGIKMRYVVEMKRSYNDDFDNWLDDYIEAETEYEALVLAKQWLIDHGYDGDVDDLIYKISEF